MAGPSRCTGAAPSKLAALIATLRHRRAGRSPWSTTLPRTTRQRASSRRHSKSSAGSTQWWTAFPPARARAELTGLFKETTPEQYTAFYHLSASWFQRLAHAAYPHLAERGGTLISFISDAGKFAAPRQTIVGAARAAAIGFVRNLAVEAARDGIRVHAISPSYVLESRSAMLMGQSRTETAAKRAAWACPRPPTSPRSPCSSAAPARRRSPARSSA